jgi:methylase of polypeptide subunit release factors
LTSATQKFDQPTERTSLNAVSAAYAAQASALALVLHTLSASAYRFVTTTPLTHQRVLKNRANHTGTTLPDIFGWSLPFAASTLDPGLLNAMDRAGILCPHGTLLRSAVRIASLGDDLFLHSSYPTTDDAAVFFGPDTYRFVRFIGEALHGSARAETDMQTVRLRDPLRILDVGCGSGAGGIAAARHISRTGVRTELVMNDINPLALRYTAINADVAGVPIVIAPGDALSAVTGDFDLIISNPPYMADAAQRAYRHGGARLGRALSARIVEEGLSRLSPGGHLMLYTGVAIVDGIDPFLAELLPLLAAADCEWSYNEIDPDVFGEELEQPAYAHVDRIAAVGLVAHHRRAP